MNITTNFDFPAIPSRRFDWSAIDSSTYDGPGSPIGHGETKQEAIEDLREQMACSGCAGDVEDPEETAEATGAELLGLWAACAATTIGFWFTVWHYLGPVIARIL